MRLGAKLAHDNVREGPKGDLRSFGMTLFPIATGVG